MQIKSRLFRFLVTLFLAVCGILSLAILEVFGSDAGKQQDLPVPATADWVVQIDAASILKEELYTVLFESKDEELLQSVKKIVEERSETDTEYPPLFINFRNDMLFYGIHKEDVSYIGVLLQLEKAELFRKNIGFYLEEGQTVAVKGNVALVMIRLSPGKQSAEQQAFTTQCLTKSKPTNLKKDNKLSNQWISVHSNNFGDGKNLDMGLLFDKHAFTLKGGYQYPGTPVTPNYSLKSNGLFISTATVPRQLSDTINKLLPLGSYQFPELQCLTMDYNGLIVENTSDGVKALPKMNAIFEAKGLFTVEGIRSNIPGEYLGPKNTIRFSSLTYYMKQLDEKTVFIGVDTTAILKQKQASLYTVKGPLHPLTDMKGNKMILSVMEIMVPQLKSAKAFIKKTDYVDFSVVRTSGDHYKVNGKIQFTKGAFAMNEVTRLLLSLTLMN